MLYASDNTPIDTKFHLVNICRGTTSRMLYLLYVFDNTWLFNSLNYIPQPIKGFFPHYAHILDPTHPLCSSGPLRTENTLAQQQRRGARPLGHLRNSTS